MEKDTFLINYLVLSWFLRPPMDFGERSLYTKILHSCHNYACRACILLSYDEFYLDSEIFAIIISMKSEKCHCTNNGSDVTTMENFMTCRTLCVGNKKNEISSFNNKILSKNFVTCLRHFRNVHGILRDCKSMQNTEKYESPFKTYYAKVKITATYDKYGKRD